MSVLQPRSCKNGINQAGAISLRAPSVLSLLGKSEYMFPLHKTHCQNLSWARPEDDVSRYSRNLMVPSTVTQLAMARFKSRTLQDKFLHSFSGHCRIDFIVKCNSLQILQEQGLHWSVFKSYPFEEVRGGGLGSDSVKRTGRGIKSQKRGSDAFPLIYDYFVHEKIQKIKF